MTPEQTAMLNAPLNAAHIKKPSGRFGPKGDYLEGWHVINELNRVFGFDGWSYSIDLSRDDLREATDGSGNPQWQAAYTCVCTLSVGDTMRQDVGFGSGFAKGIGDAIEGATKEAATDALKRCARTFGNIFGLALYDKDRANVQTAPVAIIDDAQFAILQTLIATAKADTAWLCEHYGVSGLNQLNTEQFNDCVSGLNGRIAKQGKAA